MCNNLPTFINGYFILLNPISPLNATLVCELPYVIRNSSKYTCHEGRWNGHGTCRKFSHTFNYYRYNFTVHYVIECCD